MKPDMNKATSTGTREAIRVGSAERSLSHVLKDVSKGVTMYVNMRVLNRVQAPAGLGGVRVIGEDEEE